MAARTHNRTAGRPEHPHIRSEGAKKQSQGPEPDPLGEVRPAANGILAGWALRELVARRTSKPTNG